MPPATTEENHLHKELTGEIDKSIIPVGFSTHCLIISRVNKQKSLRMQRTERGRQIPCYQMFVSRKQFLCFAVYACEEIGLKQHF